MTEDTWETYEVERWLLNVESYYLVATRLAKKHKTTMALAKALKRWAIEGDFCQEIGVNISKVQWQRVAETVRP